MFDLEIYCLSNRVQMLLNSLIISHILHKIFSYNWNALSICLSAVGQTPRAPAHKRGGRTSLGCIAECFDVAARHTSNTPPRCTHTPAGEQCIKLQIIKI